MKRKIVINVTQEDIDNGEKYNPHKCPLALSLKRDFPNFEEVSVSTGNVTIFGFLKKRWYQFWKRPVPVAHFETSDRLRAFITDFDIGLKVKPFQTTTTIEEWK